MKKKLLGKIKKDIVNCVKNGAGIKKQQKKQVVAKIKSVSFLDKANLFFYKKLIYFVHKRKNYCGFNIVVCD